MRHRDDSTLSSNGLSSSRKVAGDHEESDSAAATDAHDFGDVFAGRVNDADQPNDGEIIGEIAEDGAGCIFRSPIFGQDLGSGNYPTSEEKNSLSVGGPSSLEGGEFIRKFLRQGSNFAGWKKDGSASFQKNVRSAFDK
jgi:hypothetical protein